MPEEKSCPFCFMEEMQGDRILERRQHVFVVLSDPHLVKGHILVIPKRHVSALAQLNQDELGELIQTGIEWVEKVKKIFTNLYGQVVGCDLTQHDRPFMPTDFISVPQHLHIHLRPRTWNDELYQNVQRHETPMFARQRLNSVEITLLKAVFAENQ